MSVRLSGGETFLPSPALARSLSEHLPQLSDAGGAVSLESRFLDEGFGSLDAESLDLAVQGLETLAGGHRVIGVISHVPELAERLPDRIDVVRRGQSSAVVERRRPAARVGSALGGRARGRYRRSPLPLPRQGDVRRAARPSARAADGGPRG